MLRKLALSLAIAGVLGVPNANALGLGEINIRSALNEPLSAEIRLMQVRDLSPLQIQPRMADADEFSIAGLSKSRFLNDVRFQVQVTPDGTGIIRITSSEPVREPFLNFLVEVNWPSGRLVREYTVLLDPPVFDSAPIGGTQFQPAVTTIQAVPSSVPVSSSVAPVTRAPQTVPGEVRVGSSDTLWVMANRYRPDSSITPQQMMVALQRHNPEVFPTANINMMRAGAVMRIPSADQVRSLSAAEANAEVSRQNEEWRNRNRAAPAPQAVPESSPAVVEEAVEESVTEETAVEETAVVEEAEDLAAAAEALAEAELRIVTPEEDLASDQAEEIGDTAARVEGDETAEITGALLQRSEQLDNRLVVLEEDLDRTRLENRDLKESNDSLQEQLVLLQRMMELQAEQLAQLQLQLAEPQSSQSDLVEKLTSLPVIGGAAAALIALLAGIMLGRRKKKVPEPMFKAPEVSGDKNTAAAAATAAAATAAFAAASEEDKEDSFEDLKEEPIFETSAEVDDFSDLDLDLDLDLDEAEDDSIRVVDEEYDLSAEDNFDDLLSDSELDANETLAPDGAVELQTDPANLAEDPSEMPVVGQIHTIADSQANDDLDLSQELISDDDFSSLDDLLGEDLPEPDYLVEASTDEESDLASLDDLLASSTELTDEDSGVDGELQTILETGANDEASINTYDEDDLDFVLQDSDFKDFADEPSPEEKSSADDLDVLLGSLELEEDDASASAPVKEKMKPGEQVEEELTANIMHDLEMGLDDELDDLLNSTDDDIALEESQSDDDALDMLDSLSLLDGADENETKLDLARAYLEMDDAEGAREILGEIIAEGNDQQKEEAQKLMDNLG